MGTPKENQVTDKEINERNGERTYRVDTICSNCGFGTKTEDTFVTISMGTTVAEYLPSIKCRRCGCIGHIKKVGQIEKF